MTVRTSLTLSIIALLLLNFPLILIWDRDVAVAGLPLLPVALFVIWAAFVALVAILGEARPPRRPPPAG